MSLIVAGRFNTFIEGEKAAELLKSSGFLEEDITLFFVNPRGHHDKMLMGGDHHTDAASVDTPKGASQGVIIGAVVGALIGFLIYSILRIHTVFPVIATGIGAYVGSLMGAMKQTKHAEKNNALNSTKSEKNGRESGVLLAVHVDINNAEKARAVLRESGAKEIEKAHGRWAQGRWQDFDPVKAPNVSNDPLSH